MEEVKEKEILMKEQTVKKDEERQKISVEEKWMK